MKTPLNPQPPIPSTLNTVAILGSSSWRQSGGRCLRCGRGDGGSSGNSIRSLPFPLSLPLSLSRCSGRGGDFKGPFQELVTFFGAYSCVQGKGRYIHVHTCIRIHPSLHCFLIQSLSLARSLSRSLARSLAFPLSLSLSLSFFTAS